MNARNVQYKNNVDQIGQNRIKELNRADQKLYEHFLQKFNHAVNRFGKQRMQGEVNRLKQKTRFYYRYCVGEAVTGNNSQIVRFVNMKKYNPMCKFLTNSELVLTNLIRKEQIQRHPGSVFDNNTITTTTTTTSTTTTSSVTRSLWKSWKEKKLLNFQKN